jgi:hypothetical protein
MKWQSLLLELRGNCPNYIDDTRNLTIYKLLSNFPDLAQHRPISDIPVVQTVITPRLLQQQRPTILDAFKTPPKKPKKKEKVVAWNLG